MRSAVANSALLSRSFALRVPASNPWHGKQLRASTHAVRIGDSLMISGAVSMDDEGNLVAPGDLEQQMKNCYADLGKILAHYGYTFDDVVVENVFTTDMAGFIQVSGFRNSVYKKQFPTGTWLEVKGLALPGQLVEIDIGGVQKGVRSTAAWIDSFLSDERSLAEEKSG